jgi:hypothetical protein
MKVAHCAKMFGYKFYDMVELNISKLVISVLLQRYHLSTLVG